MAITQRTYAMTWGMGAYAPAACERAEVRGSLVVWHPNAMAVAWLYAAAVVKEVKAAVATFSPLLWVGVKRIAALK